MASNFDPDDLIEAIAAAPSPKERFEALTGRLAAIGLDIVNYGFFDLRVAKLVDADIQFLTTMSDDWMRYYYDRNLAATDPHVMRVRERKISPYRWGQGEIRRIESAGVRTTALEGAEAGLVSGLLVPLTDPLDPFTPVAGIALASSMGEEEFGKVLAEHGASLVSIAHLFHNASIRQIWRDHTADAALSARERDCLQYLADGKRQDAIAHALNLARVTVEMHLRNARKKLRARTPAEAIAKAILFGEIRRG